MKKTILSIVAGTLITVSSIAQIPNNGFENWTTIGSYQNPTDWDNLNAMTTSMGVYTCTKGTPGQTGSAFLKLVSKNVSGMGVMPGIATTGTINISNLSVTGGFPFTSRPQSLTGAWQYMASGSDAGMIAVYLTKWNTSMGMRDTVAMTVQNLSGMVMSWASFTLNLMYMNGSNPDTAQIILSSSGMTPAANSYLYVDNLAFAGNVAGIKDNNSFISNLSVYPNPASDKISIDLYLQKNASVKIQLLDLSGKIVKETTEPNVSGKINKMIEVNTLAKGVYLIKISTENGNEIRKITIE